MQTENHNTLYVLSDRESFHSCQLSYKCSKTANEIRLSQVLTGFEDI